MNPTPPPPFVWLMNVCRPCALEVTYSDEDGLSQADLHNVALKPVHFPMTADESHLPHDAKIIVRAPSLKSHNLHLLVPA